MFTADVAVEDQDEIAQDPSCSKWVRPGLRPPRSRCYYICWLEHKRYKPFRCVLCPGCEYQERRLWNLVVCLSPSYRYGYGTNHEYFPHVLVLVTYTYKTLAQLQRNRYQVLQEYKSRCCVGYVHERTRGYLPASRVFTIPGTSVASLKQFRQIADTQHLCEFCTISLQIPETSLEFTFSTVPDTLCVLYHIHVYNTRYFCGFSK